MALQDAQKVKEFLKQASDAASPLKDKQLTQKINEASEYVSKKTSGPQNN